jgi:hypothetical protein
MFILTSKGFFFSTLLVSNASYSFTMLWSCPVHRKDLIMMAIVKTITIISRVRGCRTTQALESGKLGFQLLSQLKRGNEWEGQVLSREDEHFRTPVRCIDIAGGCVSISLG